MLKFESIKEWAINKEKPLYGYVVMEPDKIEGWKENHLDGIMEEDLYEPENESYGLEKYPHVTLLYGIVEEEIDPTVIADMIEQKMEPLTVKISDVDVFENGKFDVVKYNVPVTKELLQYRNMLKDSFKNVQTYSEYKPHITIAYVKPGEGAKYKKKLDNPFKIKLTKGVYTYHKNDGTREEVRKIIDLNKNGWQSSK